ncbi:MAG: hypothetical protein F6K62_06150 [Sphaerospermopsis sp. SIO1G2]|nr:hypothetical protein [Sphaerospermopsis sp. SIO1G2]
MTELEAIKSEIQALNNKFVNKNNTAELTTLIAPIMGTVLAAQAGMSFGDLGRLNLQLPRMLNDINQVKGKLAAGIGKYSSMAAALASVGISIATLKVLAGNIDATQLGVDSLGNWVSRTLGLVTINRQRADRALAKIEQLESRLDNTVEEKVTSLSLKFNQSLSNATKTLHTGIKKLDSETNQALKAITILMDGLIKNTTEEVDRAQFYAERAIDSVENVDKKIDKVSNSLGAKIDKVSNSLGAKIEYAILQINSIRIPPIKEFIPQDLSSILTRLSALERTVLHLRNKNRGLDSAINAINTSISSLQNSIGRLALPTPISSGKEIGDQITNITQNIIIKNNQQIDQKVNALSNSLSRSLLNELTPKIGLINNGTLPTTKDNNQSSQIIADMIDRISAINSKSKALEDGLSRVNEKISAIGAAIPTTGAIEGIISSVVPKLISSQLPLAIPLVIPQIIELITPQITKISTSVSTTIVNQYQNIMEVDLSPVLRKLEQVDAKVDAIPLLALTLFTTNPKSKSWATSAAKAGTCQALQPNECGGQALKKNRRDLSNELGATNLAAQGLDLSLLKVINDKLGDQIKNAAGKKIGIGGALTRFAKSTVVDRTLNLIGTASSIHNALMLSNDIGTTLLGTIQNIINIFGIKDGNDSEYEITTILGKKLKEFIEGLIGAHNVTKLEKALAKANRIYQASSNIFSSIRSMHDTTLNLTTTVANNTGKIGNKLREQGVVDFDAYPEFSENIKPNKFSGLIATLEKGQEAASALESITSDVVSIKDDIKTITENRDNLTKELKISKPESAQSLIRNAEVKRRDDKLDRDTEPPEISSEDLPNE